VPLRGGSYPESLPQTVRARRVPLASSPPSAKAESLPLADFYSGQQPDNLAASVVDYCSGVLTSKGPIDLRGNPQDELLFGILSEISSYDNKLRAERSRMGKLNRVRQGGWLGGPPPFGYRLEDKRLVENPDESQWVKKIFGWYSKGKSPQSIKVEMDTNGVEPRRKKSSWSLGSINALLKNTHYIGHYTFTDKMTDETVEVPCPAFVDVTV
jgi:hypothetical protein